MSSPAMVQEWSMPLEHRNLVGDPAVLPHVLLENTGSRLAFAIIALAEESGPSDNTAWHAVTTPNPPRQQGFTSDMTFVAVQAPPGVPPQLDGDVLTALTDFWNVSQLGAKFWTTHNPSHTLAVAAPDGHIRYDFEGCVRTTITTTVERLVVASLRAAVLRALYPQGTSYRLS